MQVVLTTDELIRLESLRASLTPPVYSRDFTISMADWDAAQVLTVLRDTYQLDSIQAAAAMFAKRYAFLPALFLAGVSLFNKAIHVSFENTHLVSAQEDGQWMPKFYFSHKGSASQLKGNRAIWLEDSLRSIFSLHLYPIIASIGEVGKINRAMVWENVVVYVNWMYEELLKTQLDEFTRAQVEADRHYIFFEAPGECFGPYKLNPLSGFAQNLMSRKKEERQRKTCCLTFLVKEGARCSICPCAICPDDCNLEQNCL